MRKLYRIYILGVFCARLKRVIIKILLFNLILRIYLSHFIFWYIISRSIKPMSGKSSAAYRQKFIIPHIPSFIVNSKNWLSIWTFDYHFDWSFTPYIIGISHIYLLSYFNFIYFFFQLKCGKLVLFCFPLNFHIWILWICYDLCYNVIYWKTGKKNRSFCISYGFIAYKTILYKKILINIIKKIYINFLKKLTFFIIRYSSMHIEQ